MTLLRRLEDAERKQSYIEYRIAAANESAKLVNPRGLSFFAPGGTTKILGGAPWPAGSGVNLYVYTYRADNLAKLASTDLMIRDNTYLFGLNSTTNANGYSFFNTSYGFKNGDAVYISADHYMSPTAHGYWMSNLNSDMYGNVNISIGLDTSQAHPAGIVSISVTARDQDGNAITPYALQRNPLGAWYLYSNGFWTATYRGTGPNYSWSMQVWYPGPNINVWCTDAFDGLINYAGGSGTLNCAYNAGGIPPINILCQRTP